jgi:hypothetical protein
VSQFVLIYGRRAEFEEKPGLTKKRAAEERDDEYFMTFDRLEPISTSQQYMTVESKKDGYWAVSIPATVKLGPAYAYFRRPIQGKDECVERSPFMTEARKAFLRRRFAYWDKYGRTRGGFMHTGDRE